MNVNYRKIFQPKKAADGTQITTIFMKIRNFITNQVITERLNTKEANESN